MIYQESLKFLKTSVSACEITEQINQVIRESGVRIGTCQLFVHSNHASILVGEIADSSTRASTPEYLARLAPNSDEAVTRINASIEAIPENQRPALMQTSLSLPVGHSRAAIGVWHGIYLWGRDAASDDLKVTLTVMGE